MPMQPRPIAETSRLERPSMRRAMDVLMKTLQFDFGLQDAAQTTSALAGNVIRSWAVIAQSCKVLVAMRRRRRQECIIRRPEGARTSEHRTEQSLEYRFLAAGAGGARSSRSAGRRRSRNARARARSHPRKRTIAAAAFRLRTFALHCRAGP